MVPRTRLELVQPLSPGILSPLRLPIPPPGHLQICKTYLLKNVIQINLELVKTYFQYF